MLKMKSLRESLLDNDLVEKTDNLIRDGILDFLVKNYEGSYKISEKPNKDDLYEVSCTNRVNIINENITSLTNGYFIWTVVKGSFICHNCNSLKNEIIEYAIKNQNIFFVQDSKDFVFGNDITKTIGISDISFFFISGLPTLIEIDNSILVNHVVGVNNIRKTLFL